MSTMTSFSQHQAGCNFSEEENLLELAQMKRGHTSDLPMESVSAQGNITNETNMDQNIKRDSRRSNENERRFVASENPEIVIEESLQLHEEQTYVREDQATFVLTFEDMSALEEGALNAGSSTDTSDSWTETTDLETSSFVSVVSQGDSSTGSTSPPLNRALSMCFNTSESTVQDPGPSTSASAVLPSTSLSSEECPSVTASASASGWMERTPSQLLDPGAAGALFAGKLSPLMYIPPPLYTAQPPSYDAVGHSRSLATVSELQRSAPLTLEMPPPYDDAVDGGRRRGMRDLRQRNTSRWSSSSGRKCSISCCAAYVAFVILVVMVYVFFSNV